MSNLYDPSKIASGNTAWGGILTTSGTNAATGISDWFSYTKRHSEDYRSKIYYEILQLEKPKLTKLEYSIENLNNMLTSLDIDSRNMAIDIICVNTKYLGLFLKAAVRQEDMILEQVIDQFLKDRYCTLL